MIWWLMNEWISTIRHPKRLIVFIGILFIPILYSGTYLWAFWDPYAHLERLPVAVVNEDRPVTYEGTTYSIGKELVDQLKKDHSFEWHFVSRDEAEKGLQNQTFYFEIRIPRDFSKRATTLVEGTPKPLELYYEANEGFNYIASCIGQTGVETIRQRLATTLTEKYAEALFAQVEKLGEGFEQASRGAEKISNGLADLSTGTGKIIAGMKQQGAIAQFPNGAKQLENGTARLAQGAVALQNGMADIRDGMQQLHAGTAQLSNRSTEFIGSACRLLNRVTQMHETIQTYIAQHPQLQQDPTFTQKVEAARATIDGGIQRVTTAVDMFQTNMNKLNDSTGQLAQGAEAVHAKLGELASGAKTIHDSMGKLADGAQRVSNGWNEVIDHLVTLQQGEIQLLAGSRELSNRLADGAQQVQRIHADQQLYQMFANPVRLKEKKVHEVPNYGTGMAPYFLSISLYVGALLLTTVYPLRETESEPPHAFAWFLSKFVILMVVSLGQTVIMVAILTNFIGLKPLYTGQLYLFSFFVSLVFMAIAQFLVTAANNVGRFIGIVLFVLQLTASSGTYPVELVPQPLQDVHSLLPMTYTVEGFRVLISTGDFELLRNDMFILTIFLFVSVMLTCLWMWWRRKREVPELPATS